MEGERKSASLFGLTEIWYTEFSVNGDCSAVGLLFIGFCQNDRFYVLPGERYF